MIKLNELSVSELNGYIQGKLTDDIILNRVNIKGEISNYTDHKKTGHLYFTLKDAKSSIKAIMFKSSRSKLKYDPEDGMEVIVTGRVKLYEKDGSCQVYCDNIKLDGTGSLYLAYEQLKRKLEVKGYFNAEHKKDLPKYPKKIGIVTSETGAALQDMLNIIGKRYPMAKVVLIPTIVQGEQAPKSISKSIQVANQTNDIDVLIVGRGGGSLEDLFGFNYEEVADAIYKSKIPIVSAVGHQTDYTIADLVADKRAATPSVAAEMVTPDNIILKETIDKNVKIMYNLTTIKLNSRIRSLVGIGKMFKFMSPQVRLSQKYKTIEKLEKLLKNYSKVVMQNKQSQYKKVISLIDALSPLKVMERGYSITYHNNKVIDSIEQLELNAELETFVKDGKVISVVKHLKKEEK